MDYTNKIIAPCGLNCMLCQNHLKKEKQCLGCNEDSPHKPSHCKTCFFMLCDKKQNFCFECAEYPCKKLKDFDSRYKKNYNYSLIESLQYYKTHGFEKLIQKDITQNTCKTCGKLKSIHYNHECEK